ncbi:stage III sporulation protein AA [Anaerobacterium chartisolvens]|nr:stage III sporulation protein AA [Anaerobacterium chartisolvens]
MPCIAQTVRAALEKIAWGQRDSIQEIRLRASKPLMLHNLRGDWFVHNDGGLSKDALRAYTVSQGEVVCTLELMSQNSIYAYQEDIKNGFITLKGGHRIGLTGRVVMDGSNIKNIKDISGLNIRISNEIKGCASGVAGYITDHRGGVYNTLVISPPQCGKTTILRDITRILSDGMRDYGLRGFKVGVIDERSEIAACFKGVPQNSLGVRTDVLDACPKTLGMEIMLRSMSPEIIVTDEIGNQGDSDAILKVVNAGIKIITSAHGYSISEMKARQEVVSLMEQRIFERYIVLSSINGPGTVEEVIDGMTMKKIYWRDLKCC